MGTDSREIRPDGSFKDTTQKLFELAPGFFFAVNGWIRLANAQTDIARCLARSADLTSLQGFADALDRASQPAMDRKVAEILATRSHVPFCEQDASGAKPFHGYALASVGGYLVREFRLKDGRVVQTETSSFGLPAGSFSVFACPLAAVENLVLSPETWAGGLVQGAEKLMDGLRSAIPYIGGPSQMVCIDRTGARWVHPPSNTAAPAPQPDNNTMKVVGGQLTLGDVPLSNVLTALGSYSVPLANMAAGLASFTYAGNIAVNQLIAGTTLNLGTSTFASSATGPAVLLGGSGLIFRDNYGTPLNTMTCSSAGINITGGGSSGITIAAPKFGGGTYTAVTMTAVNGLEFWDAAGSLMVQISNLGVTINNGSLSSPSISGGSMSGTSLAITSGSVTVNVDATNFFKVLDASAGIRSQISNTGFVTASTANANQNAAVTTSGFSVSNPSTGALSSLNVNTVYLNGFRVLSTRQAGPGNPSFASLSDVQTWCQNLYNALNPSGHGLLT